MLDEIFCTKSTAKEQVVQETGKPPRRRLGVGDRAHPKENMEDGLGNSDVSRTRWTHQESEDKDCYAVYDRPIHKLCLIATKQELN